MKRIKESFCVVLNGDWNKLHVQPDWISANVFTQEKIEIEVHGKGDEFTVGYFCGGVYIIPSQSKFTFGIRSDSGEEVPYLCKCVSNFIKEAKSAIDISYGYNSIFKGEEKRMSYMMDDCADRIRYLDVGGVVERTRIDRRVRYKEKLYNISVYCGQDETVSINEHHEASDYIEITEGTFQDYINNSWDLLESLGYERED
jgi:hypothetical protein